MPLFIVSSDRSTLFRQACEVASLLGFDDIRTAETVPDGPDCVFVADGDPVVRRQKLDALAPDRGINLIHPSAVVSASAKLASNIFVGAQAAIGMDARVGRGLYQNALSSIEHDNEIGEFVMLGTGAILCGGVTVGEFSLIGGGATVKPGTSVGARTTIGSGAVLVKNADSDATYIGNPARKIS